MVARVLWRLRSSQRHALHVFPAFHLLIVGLCFIAVLADITTAATYYADAVNGDDSNPGTSEQPWKTLTYALGATSPVGPGDTIYLRAGLYREHVWVEKFGSSGNWITVKGYPNETAVLDGTSVITGWTQSQSDDSYLTVQGVVNPHYASIYWTRILATSFPTSLVDTKLFENREMGRIASDPDQSVGFGEDYLEFRTISEACAGQRAYIIDTTLTQANDYWNGSILRIMEFNDNATTDTRNVADFVSADHKIILDSAVDADLRYDAQHKDSYRFVNHPHILDSAGELYVSAIENVGGTDYRRVYYWPKNPANLTANMSIASRDETVYHVGTYDYYLIFEDLTVFGTKGAGILFYGLAGGFGSHVTVRNCTITDCGHEAIRFTYMNDVRAENNYVRRCGETGILENSGNRCVFKGNDVGDTGNTNITFFETIDGTMINNTLRGIRGTHGNGTAVYGGGDPLVLCDYILLAGNIYYNTNMAFNDTKNLVVFSNLFVNDEDDPHYAISAWGSRYDGYQVWINNTIPIADSYALYLHQQKAGETDLPHHYVINNVFHGLTKGWTEKWDEYDPSKVIVEARTHNIYTNYSSVQSTFDGWSLKEGEQDRRTMPLTDLFVNPTYPDGDYRTKENSPLRGAGKNVQGILTNLGIIAKFPEYDFTKDLAGNAWNSTPSIGCYEYRGPVLGSIGDKSVYVNESLNFTVSATDPDADPITYSAQNLPSGATFQGQAFSWTPTGGQVGTYQVTFIASDGSEQDSETITITVKSTNQAPTANAGPDQTAIDSDGNGSQQVTLNGSGSTDSDGTIQSYVWTEGGTQIATGVNPTVTLSVGQHTITLTVTDDGGLTDTDAVTITVDSTTTTYTLTIGATNGSVTKTPDKGSYSHGETVTLQAMPNNGYSFTSWSGDLSGSTNPATITMNSNKSVNANFSPVDQTAPSVTNCSPQADAIQVPLNNLITLHIVDAGKGVDANSVTIKVNNNTVYSGNTANYTSAGGNCRRTGTKADYTFTYQPSQTFDFEQQLTVTVNATDLGGNVMPEYTYSFWTEMRSFGKNKKVSSGLDNLACGAPSTVRDSNGNIYVVWHAGPTGSRDTYIAKLTEGAGSFGSSIPLTADSADQCNPAIAVGSSDKLYVVWQDNRRGNWDVYMSSSADGVNWSTASRISDSNDNETNPVIAVGSAGSAGIVWQQDDQTGNRDIYIATSSDGFATKAISQITTNASDQTDPAITVGSANTVYVVWTDKRNGSNDIYGAASNNGPWTNVPIVNKAGNQSSPAIAAETAGSILHLLWVDDASGNSDIYHAATNGLPSSPVAGSNIIDDSSGRNQVEPTIAVTRSTGSNLKVFTCWQDRRNVAGASGDTDLYFAEISSDGGTNVFVGDDSTNSNQSQPAIGVDAHGHPYLVWSDSRTTNAQIYYAGSSYLDSEALDSKLVVASAGATVRTNPASIASIDDVSVVVPAGACSSDVRITISKIENPQQFAVQCLAAYDFGPSGIQFSQPVTITIPYSVPASQGSAKPYWYNAPTGAFTQQGITDIHDIVLSPTLHALSFKTTHFTPFYVVEGTAGGTAIAGGGGGGGGGCSVSAAGNGSVVEFLLPYMVLAAVMMILKLHDTRGRKSTQSHKRRILGDRLSRGPC